MPPTFLLEVYNHLIYSTDEAYSTKKRLSYVQELFRISLYGRCSSCTQILIVVVCGESSV